jgi:Ca2+-binding EF-hand superfamily protein
MQTRTILSIAFLAGASIAAPALASDHGHKPKGLHSHIEKMDLDADGKVSKEEFIAFGSNRAAEMFEMADTNSDGSVSKEEFLAAKPDRQDKMFEKLDRNGDGFISKDDMKPRGDKGYKGKKGESEGQNSPENPSE